jgi:hypothetical protein
MSIPLLKLEYLLIRTLSKPIANSIKQQAVEKPSFRNSCMKLAQSYHSMEVHMRHRLKSVNGTDVREMDPVRPLDEKKAIELGANFIGEFLIFSIAGVLVTLEALRSSRNEKARREETENRIVQLEDALQRIMQDKSKMEAAPA